MRAKLLFPLLLCGLIACSHSDGARAREQVCNPLKARAPIVEDIQAQALQDAVLQGDLDTVRSLLDKGAHADSLTRGYRSPLHAALAPTIADPGENPLDVQRSVAARLPSQLALIELLLSRGADPGAVDIVGYTPLHFAVVGGYSDAQSTALLAPLLRGAGDRDAKDAFGSTALMQAAALGKTQSVRALLQAGADPRVTDCHGRTAAQIARQRRHPDTARLLEK